MVAIDIVIPLDLAQRREWIKYQLGLRGYTLGKLAREIGVSRSCTKASLHRPYPRMEREIARVIGVAPHKLWPERYDAEGNSNRPMGRPVGSGHGRKLITPAPQAGNGKRQEGR